MKLMYFNVVQIGDYCWMNSLHLDLIHFTEEATQSVKLSAILNWIHKFKQCTQ